MSTELADSAQPRPKGERAEAGGWSSRVPRAHFIELAANQDESGIA